MKSGEAMPLGHSYPWVAFDRAAQVEHALHLECEKREGAAGVTLLGFPGLHADAALDNE